MVREEVSPTHFRKLLLAAALGLLPNLRRIPSAPGHHPKDHQLEDEHLMQLDHVWPDFSIAQRLKIDYFLTFQGHEPGCLQGHHLRLFLRRKWS